jgi:hypothetical protein
MANATATDSVIHYCQTLQPNQPPGLQMQEPNSLSRFRLKFGNIKLRLLLLTPMVLIASDSISCRVKLSGGTVSISNANSSSANL